MKIETTELRDVLLITPDIYRDERGYFFEGAYAKDISSRLGKEVQFVQSNCSFSLPHILRGLHYQLRGPMGKVVRCLKGSIWDVAVDLRRSSPTFKQWVMRNLNEERQQALWVPPGFGHGFLAGSSGAIVQYECTTYYDKQSDRALAWNDPDLGIKWPLAQGIDNPILPILSGKDRGAPTLQAAEIFP